MSLATLICSISCSKDDEYVSSLKRISIADVVVEAIHNTTNVSFGQADLSNCKVVTTASWCTANVSQSNVNVTVLENNTYEERAADITVTDTKDNTTLSFKVTQKQNDAIIIGSDFFEISEGGEDISIEVKSNVEYMVDLSGIDWIKDISQTRSLNQSIVKLAVEANTSDSVREAVVKIKSKDGKITSNVTIKQLYTPIQITPTTVSMYYDDTAQLIANKTVSWSIDNEFIAKVDENGLVTGRHIGNATITASNGASSGECSITIKPKYYLYDTPMLKWGEAKTVIMETENHTVTGTPSEKSVIYDYSFGSTVCLVGYSFENGALSGVIVMLNYTSTNYVNTGYYLLERFQPIGVSEGMYAFIDSMDPVNATTVVGFTTSGSGSSKRIQVLYIPSTSSTNTRSNTPDYLLDKYEVMKKLVICEK